MNTTWKWAVVAFVAGTLVLTGGTLFKILHWAGADEMLVVGLLIELVALVVFVTWYIRFGSRN